MFRYHAPDLDGLGDKRKEQLAFGGVRDVEKNLLNWLKIKVADPGRFADDRIITRMPDFNFNDKETDALVTFLLGLRKKSIPVKYKKVLVNNGSVRSRGDILIEKFNCKGCHQLNKEGGTIGPDLTFEARKSRQEWLFSFLKSPVKIRPDHMLKARMPDFNLSDIKVNTIIEYLSSKAGESYPYTENTRRTIYLDDIRNGEKLYHEIFACIGCHQVQGSGGEIGPNHTDLSSRLKRDWLKQWLTDPRAIKPDVRMPRFRFKDWEFEAMNNYLMTLGAFRFVEIKED
jgi:mono/diheme cytochrome c family protein